MTCLLSPMTLVILAGGDSKRMGIPKHCLAFSDGTVIDHLIRRLSPLFVETLIVGRDLPPVAEPGVRVIADARDEKTPLVGIYSGLLAARTDFCFVIACDMPFVSPAIIRTMQRRTRDCEIVVPVVKSYFEPLCAFYRQSAIPIIACALDAGTRKITTIYRDLLVRTVDEEELRADDPELVSFINLNTPRELPLLARLMVRPNEGCPDLRRRLPGASGRGTPRS